MHQERRESTKGLSIYISPINTPDSIIAVQKTQSLCQPFKSQLNEILDTHYQGDNVNLANKIVLATAYGREHNLTLLKFMSKLTVVLESVAA